MSRFLNIQKQANISKQIAIPLKSLKAIKISEKEPERETDFRQSENDWIFF